jgi:hypothetical protein
MDGSDRVLFKREIKRSSCGVIAADFPRGATRFFFNWAKSEVRTIGAVAKILSDPLLKAATAFALRDVDEIMQNQFAIVPSVDANDESATKTHAPCAFGQDAQAFRRLGQFRIFRQRNPIDREHADGGAILHPGETRIVRVPQA